MKTSILCIFFTLMWLMGFAQQKMALSDCLAFALENSQKIKLAQLDRSNIDYVIKEKKSVGLPQVSASADFRRLIDRPRRHLPGEFFGSPAETVPLRFGTKNSWEGGITARQVLYDKSLFSKRKMEQLSTDVYDLLIQQSEEEIIYGVAERYFSILKNEEQKKVLELNREKLEKLLKMVELQYKNDFAKATDVKNLEVKLSGLKVKRMQLDAGIETQYKALKLLMGMPLHENISIAEEVPSAGQALDTKAPSKENITRLRLLEQQRQLEQQSLQATQNEALPTLEALGYLGFQFQQNGFAPFDGDGWTGVSWLGLGVKVPIFDGFERKSKLQQHQIKLQQIRLKAQQAEQFSDFEYQNALADLQNKKELLSAQKETLNLLNELYQQTLLQFKEDNSSLLEMLNAESDLRQATFLFNQQLFDYKLATLKLLQTQGRLRSLL